MVRVAAWPFFLQAKSLLSDLICLVVEIVNRYFDLSGGTDAEPCA
jgi:hypothetical protein